MQLVLVVGTHGLVTIPHLVLDTYAFRPTLHEYYVALQNVTKVFHAIFEINYIIGLPSSSVAPQPYK
jgi:hypothetical protein